MIPISDLPFGAPIAARVTRLPAVVRSEAIEAVAPVSRPMETRRPRLLWAAHFKPRATAGRTGRRGHRRAAGILVDDLRSRSNSVR